MYICVFYGCYLSTLNYHPSTCFPPSFIGCSSDAHRMLRMTLTGEQRHYSSLKAHKVTTFFLYTQARTYFLLKKVHFCPKNTLLSTFNFQLSTFYCTFASYFGIIWAFCKKIENIILNCQLSIVNYTFSCYWHVSRAPTTIPRVRMVITESQSQTPPIRISLPPLRGNRGGLTLTPSPFPKTQ